MQNLDYEHHDKIGNFVQGQTYSVSVTEAILLKLHRRSSQPVTSSDKSKKMPRRILEFFKWDSMLHGVNYLCPAKQLYLANHIGEKSILQPAS